MERGKEGSCLAFFCAGGEGTAVLAVGTTHHILNLVVLLLSLSISPLWLHHLPLPL